MFGLDGVDAHQRGFMCEINQSMVMDGRVVVNAELAEKRLVRAMQRTQFHAKSAKNDLKPTDFLKRNFYFKTEGVLITPHEQDPRERAGGGHGWKGKERQRKCTPLGSSVAPDTVPWARLSSLEPRQALYSHLPSLSSTPCTGEGI
jgi:hypothetical protein